MYSTASFRSFSSCEGRGQSQPVLSQISRIRPTSCGLCYSECSIRDCLQEKGANHPGSTNCALALLSFVQYLKALGPPHRQCASGLELSTGSSCVREFQGTGPMER